MTAGVALTTTLAVELWDIDYVGTFAEGTLIGGLWGAAAQTPSDVYRTTNPTSSVVNWYGVAGAANMPTGTSGASANVTAWVVMSPDYVNDSTIFLMTSNDNGVTNDTNVWRSQDGGVTWTRLWTSNFAGLTGGTAATVSCAIGGFSTMSGWRSLQCG